MVSLLKRREQEAEEAAENEEPRKCVDILAGSGKGGTGLCTTLPSVLNDAYQARRLEVQRKE